MLQNLNNLLVPNRNLHGLLCLETQNQKKRGFKMSLGDFDLDNPGDESGFSNIKGYFFLITKVLHSRIEAFINKDITRELDCLYTLRNLLIGYFTPEELTQLDTCFNEISHLQQQNTNAERLHLHKKSTQTYTLLRNKMNWIADTLSTKMHKSNLYTMLREKGSYLYN